VEAAEGPCDAGIQGADAEDFCGLVDYPMSSASYATLTTINFSFI